MTIENDRLRVTLDPQTGGFASIRDKRDGDEYVDPQARPLPLRFIAPHGELRAAPIDANNARITANGHAATIEYHLNGIGATVALTLDDDAILAQVTVTNDGNRTIEETIFPWVRGLAPIDDAALVFPYFFDRRIDDPLGAGLDADHITWNELGQKKTYRYPAHLASPWLDYGNARRGIALEGRHKDFSILDFYVRKDVNKTSEPIRRTLDLATVQPRRVEPGQTWQSAPVRIVVHIGDWHAVADAHRRWLETWTAKPNRPAKFAEAIGWHFFFMKHQDGLVLNTYDDLPKMAEAALAAGCPYLLVFGWQTGGHDNHYLYRYVPNEDWGGAAALRDAVEKARAMGVEVMPFFNGTLANIEMPEHKEFGHRWEAKTRAGHPYYAGNWARHNFDAPTRNRDMLHYEICPCDGHRTYFLDTVRRMIGDYGFRNIQLDQISEKMFPCYNPLHGHDKPDRAYVDGMIDLLASTQRIVRETNPDGVVIGEWINELTAQWLDSSWCWRQTKFPEPVLYTLPWAMLSHEIDALEYDEVNKAFAYKLHLDMKIDGGDSPITKYPDFAAHVKRLAELRRRVRDYYVYAAFRDQEGIDVDPDDRIIAKVFHDRDASHTGIVVAELTGNAATVSVRSDWKPNTGDVRIDSSLIEPRTLASAETMKLKLRPYEVQVICIDG